MIDVNPLKENNILYLSVLKDEIDFAPDYQRESDIWPVSKKQLFIDSLINNLDIPKLYFHEVQKTSSYPFRYAVVDGKQRLEALFSFLKDEFAISDDFEDLSGAGIDVKGKKYSEFLSVGIRFKTFFDARQLPIFLIKTDDKDLIDEMFFRLNEAAPLNAAEKRNSYRGPYSRIVRELASHPFFQSKVSFSSRRYRHHDVIGKVLLLSHSPKTVDTKKIHLDSFAKSLAEREESLVASLQAEVVTALDFLGGVFTNSDRLLKSAAFVPLLFLAYKQLKAVGQESLIDRAKIEEFDRRRLENRMLARDNEEAGEVNYSWLEYDRLIQSPNDSSSIEFRKDVFIDFLSN